jgi:hypothetical protein
VARVGEREHAGIELEHAAQHGHEQAGPALLDEDPVRPLERNRRVARAVERGTQDRPDEGHEQRRGDALARDVCDDDAELPRPVGVEQREDVEEVAADLARGPVVVRDLPALGLDAGEQDEGSLDALSDAELALQQLGVRMRRSGSLERGDRVGSGRVQGED